MELADKLRILADSAKYDVACTSSGIDRKGEKGKIGSAASAGICHSFSADGRCISLLKVLLTNVCIYDCKYCNNRKSNDIERAIFSPDELAELMINFYKRNYIEGLFLSSAIVKNPDYTMELLYKTLFIIRTKYNFNGYIHVKAIPGADDYLILKTGQLADRMSVNIELPSESSLMKLAPDKTKHNILEPMKLIKNQITETKNEIMLYKHATNFVPAGQSTQLIVGATPESDKKIITLSENLYSKYKLKRVFYSAYIPVSKDPLLPKVKNPPLLREHRLYQADWLLRYYDFKAEDLLKGENDNFDLAMDPKCQWAVNNYHLFPVEVLKADYTVLLKVPGIGVQSARKIVKARRTSLLDFDGLKKLGISLKRAKYFITCNGKIHSKYISNEAFLYNALVDKSKLQPSFEQLSLFETNNLLLEQFR